MKTDKIIEMFKAENPTSTSLPASIMEKIEYESTTLPVHNCYDYMDELLNGCCDFHWHDELEFAVVLRGSVDYKVISATGEVRERILHEGDGVFVNSRSIHFMQRKEKNSFVFCIVIPRNFFHFLSMDAIHTNCIKPIIDCPLTCIFLSNKNVDDSLVLAAMLEMYHSDVSASTYDLHRVEIISRLFINLINRISKIEIFVQEDKSASIEQSRIRMMLAYIYSHYSEKLTAENIAKAAGISRTECFRCFAHVLGETPHEFLNRYRLSKASELLKYSTLPIQEISFSCGFASPSYFTAKFKEINGTSPREYRNTISKSRETPYT